MHDMMPPHSVHLRAPSCVWWVGVALWFYLPPRDVTFWTLEWVVSPPSCVTLWSPQLRSHFGRVVLQHRLSAGHTAPAFRRIPGPRAIHVTLNT